MDFGFIQFWNNNKNIYNYFDNIFRFLFDIIINMFDIIFANYNYKALQKYQIKSYELS